MTSISTIYPSKASGAQVLRPLSEKSRFNENLLTACFFAICLFVFFSVSVTKCLSRKIVLHENRQAAKFPHLQCNWDSLCSFPESFNDYFDDRCAFRDRLIAFKALMYLKLFHVSGSSQVVIGKNGFLFYADKANRPMLMGSRPFSKDELEGWKKLLEHRHKWCLDKGMDYFFALTPAKSSIYPSLLPDEYSSRARLTRTDQLIKFLQQTHSPVRIIDLRGGLRSTKDSLPLYLKTDTHWNQLGAYYGYTSLIEGLRRKYPEIHPATSLSEFNVRPYHFDRGDLARLQGLIGILSETSIQLNPKHPPAAHLYEDSGFTENKIGGEDTKAFGYHQNGTHLPSVVMFRDSFASYMIELFLPEHFSRISFFWQPEFSESIVQREKPDIVLQELLESCLYCDLPQM
jgi:alginate O-acetyltransferase complex protein AlgJ